jgi:glutaredoxin-related protein
LRAKKLTQTTLETKWIKMLFSDGTGESEAINFIRNQAGHINRELEKVTIRLPLNETDAILNLLSFISIKDQKRTNNETRKGWIVDHKISWKNKEVVFKILLDISQFDPFLVQLNIIQDNAAVTEIIQQDATATSIIQNGTGK